MRTLRWAALLSLLVPLVPLVAAAQVVLNEIEVNPPTGGDDPWEYVELRGPAGASLLGLQLVVVDGDGGGEGFADLVVDFGSACDGVCALGTNGLAIVKAAAGGHTPAAATTVVGDTQLSTAAGGIENGSITVVLVAGPTTLAEGTDYDANDDGTLELPAGDAIADAVGWTDGDGGDVVYGGVALTGGGTPPDAATRFAGDDTPLAAAAWYHGDLSGNANGMAYDLDGVSANFPIGGRLTPGAANEPPAVATTTTIAPAASTTTLPPAIPVALRVAVVRPSRLFRFVARGSFQLPDVAVDDPRIEGGSLGFAGTTGGATYPLAASGWRGLGREKDGSKGFRFAGRPCRAVVVRANGLKGVCRGDTGTIGLPEPGPLTIVLGIGDGIRYCGTCGGVAKGKRTVLFRHQSCAAPASCPQ